MENPIKKDGVPPSMDTPTNRYLVAHGEKKWDGPVGTIGTTDFTFLPKWVICSMSSSHKKSGVGNEWDISWVKWRITCTSWLAAPNMTTLLTWKVGPKSR